MKSDVVVILNTAKLMFGTKTLLNMYYLIYGQKKIAIHFSVSVVRSNSKHVDCTNHHYFVTVFVSLKTN